MRREYTDTPLCVRVLFSFQLDGIMLILWIYFGSGTRGLLAVDIGEIQRKG